MALMYDDFGRSALTHAILHHQTKEALRLLRKCDNVNHQDKAGYTDLFFAAQSLEVDIVQELLKRGADPNIEAVGGGRVLLAALGSAQKPSSNAYERAFEIVKLLLAAGANPDKAAGKMRGSARQLAKYLAPGPINDYLQI